VLAKLVNILNSIVPKKRNMIYLKSDFVYKDNTQAILDELLRQKLNDKYKLICEGSGFEDYYNHNITIIKKGIKSVIYYLRSRYVIYDIGLYGGFSPVKNQIKVNLWHGTAWKKIGYQELDYKYGKRQERKTTTSHILATSDFFKPVMADSFGVSLSDVIVSGNPRNDYFANGRKRLPDIGIAVEPAQKVLLWMPTWRACKVREQNEGKQYEYGFPVLDSENVNLIDELCKKLNVVLILKWHGMQIEDNSLKPDQFTNIKLLTSEMIGEAKCSLYEIVGQCDGLITDYSSIYIDYLVLDRPIYFIYDDLEEYKSTRGMIVDNPEEYFPGKKGSTYEELCNIIKEFADGKDEFKEERERVNKILNKYSDFNNAKRVLEAIGIK